MNKINNKKDYEFSRGFTLMELIISITWFLILIYLSTSITASYIKLLKNIDTVGKSLLLTENILEEYFYKPYAEIDGGNYKLFEDVELIEEIETVEPDYFGIADGEKPFKKIRLSLRVREKPLLILYTLKSP
ncbi:MAG: hypothetical protein DDT42_00061 [candidate division WS2 bacterium]|uniref:Prepilin-type N-terminal cleavage/methylation domain-containing protein n=1 Tax=Psychracetigena formicireducens TaxID=2986056 RepID=A0A9E2BFW3_PSYF1|nr:hypothetical protein [Candidatus Psychracetigena formicireducens]MBT9144229.1 hypothetical protein [Candidatus Psychracetigena formicireducens]